MSINATELLRKLGGGAGLTMTQGTAAQATAQATGGASTFAGMLTKAAGVQGPSSGIAVTVEPFAGVELNSGQLERIARFADMAEREGATRALVLIDDQMLMMDVTTRTITGKADSSSHVLTDFDAVVRVPPADSNEMGPKVGLPGNGLVGVAPSLLTALSSTTDSKED